MDIKIFVEGIADYKFLSDYISFKYNIELSKDDIIKTGGWTTIKSQKTDGEKIRNIAENNTDNGGVNLLIFDADDNYKERLINIYEWKKQVKLDFEVFLWPNNSESGDLEVTLENIINSKNSPIFECWSNYEKCLSSKKIEDREVSLTIPARKTKIYGYLEALLGESKNQKKKIKEEFRNYKKPDFWELDSEYLNSLKDFLNKFFIK